MKKLLTYLTVALSLIIWFGTNTTAQTLPHQLTVELRGEDKDIPEEDPFGFRMPTAPNRCVIDFSSLSITSERIPMVLFYELWDEAGEAIVASYSNDYEMVTFMASQSGCFQLRLVTAESVYKGYIDL